MTGWNRGLALSVIVGLALGLVVALPALGQVSKAPTPPAAPAPAPGGITVSVSKTAPSKGTLPKGAAFTAAFQDLNPAIRAAAMSNAAVQLNGGAPSPAPAPPSAPPVASYSCASPATGGMYAELYAMKNGIFGTIHSWPDFNFSTSPSDTLQVVVAWPDSRPNTNHFMDCEVRASQGAQNVQAHYQVSTGGMGTDPATTSLMSNHLIFGFRTPATTNPADKARASIWLTGTGNGWHFGNCKLYTL